MGPVLHWDLSRDARRGYLLETTLAQLGEARRSRVRDALAHAGVDDAHRHDLAAVLSTITRAALSARVRRDARAVYQILAEAEAAAHGCTVAQTHFHEVGNGEAIRNAVGICLAVEALAPALITATPVQTGQGRVECAHGTLDIPAPATAAIIARGIPVCAEKLEGELCTPTSAAVILHFVDRFDV